MSRRRRAEELALDSDPLWYKDAIIYELHVRAFFDSDGDGIGDFRGLITKLDYLHDLGVTALWLLPFYPSPLKDDGYDIADYTGINPMYGDLADFKLFLREAHQRGLRVITELVVNHTSDQHPWFQRARRAKRGSNARDFYVWSDTSNRYPEARIIFKDFEPSNWAWDPVAGQFYWHRFYAHQPDLNYDNPEVHKAVLQALDFWLAMGIDGLRLDAVPYLYERDGTNCENLPETHEFLRKLRRHVDERFQSRMLLAEANQWPEDAVAYFGQGDECHMAFHFPLMPRLFMGIRMEDRFPIVDILQQTPSIPEQAQWAMFLRNHDELTLEMVTDEDRDYMYRVYAQDPQARINLGIRRRLAPLLGNHRAKIELMNGLLFSLHGTPVIYYGDEIGMGDNIYLGDRNGVRTPMQWDSERNAGFSQANPQKLYLPVIIDPEYHFGAVNVEAQQNQPHSLLWRTKHLIALRKRYRAFGRGSLELLYPENPKVLAFVRRYQEEIILVVANLSRLVQYVELDLAAFRGMTPVEMLGRTTFPPIGDLPYLLTLGGHSIYWFQLEPRPTAALPTTAAPAALPEIEFAGGWQNVHRGKGRLALEPLLTTFVRNAAWYPRKARTVEASRILDTIPVGSGAQAAQIVLLQFEYAEGDAQTYCLPVAAAGGAQAEQLLNFHADAVIGRLRDKKPGAADVILYDAFVDRDFQRALLEVVLRRRKLKGAAGELTAPIGPRPSNGAPIELPEPTLIKGRHRHTAIAYGDRLFLKVLRVVEDGVNSEWEVGRFLADGAGFAHIPPPLGTLEYHQGRNRSMTLALLDGFVPNEGDAWQHTLDSLGRFFERALMEQRKPELPPLNRPFLELTREEMTPLAQDMIGSYLESVRLLGRNTAELHLALASAADNPAFAPEPLTPFDLRSLYQSFRTQIRRSLDLLRKRLKQLPDNVRDEAQKLLGREDELLRRGRAILEQKISGMRLRGHGDLQLTQILYTGKDFVVIGFDGEPGRSSTESRLKRSPLRDVASMLRSFHYANRVALSEKAVRPEDLPTLEPWARFWNIWVGIAYLRAYLTTAGAASFLPADDQARSALLYFYLLKRAANELRFELNMNSERVHVPVHGLHSLLEIK